MNNKFIDPTEIPSKTVIRRRAKAHKIKYPSSIEAVYTRLLLNYVDDMRKAFMAEFNNMKSHLNDSIEYDVSRLMASLEGAGVRKPGADVLKKRVFTSLGKFNWRQNVGFFKAVMGVDVFTTNAMTAQLDEFASEGVSLIKSIGVELHRDVQGVVTNAVANGISHRDTAKLIGERFGVTKSRAKLIARDQTAKANSALTKARQTELGIDKYEWSTSNDSRVREDHSVMDGLLCRWDDPTVYSDDDGKSWSNRANIGGVLKHPGEDYQCRCVASPYIVV